MKTFISSLLVFLFMTSISLSAQNLEQPDQKIQPSNKLSFSFVSNVTSSLDLKLPIQSFKKNHFLAGAGYLLKGLKFSSVVDEFNATVPFDFRAFEPSSFSSYSETIQKNQLLINPTRVIK